MQKFFNQHTILSLNILMILKVISEAVSQEPKSIYELWWFDFTWEMTLEEETFYF